MFRSAVYCSIALSLAGCAPTVSNYYVKQGVTYDQYQRDALACANEATANAPDSNQVQWAPYVGVYTVDANTGLRNANVEICMRNKGYSNVAIPYCPMEKREAAFSEGFGDRNRLNQRLSVGQETCVVNGGLLYTP